MSADRLSATVVGGNVIAINHANHYSTHSSLSAAHTGMNSNNNLVNNSDPMTPDSQSSIFPLVAINGYCDACDYGFIV